MRILEIRETAIPLNSKLKNSSFDFSEMTTSLVAVITNVVREGRPVVGFAFNSTGRYACGAQMRARFIPRILKADPKSLLDATGENLDPAKILAVMMQREKSGGHSERSVGIGTIEVAVWDAVAKIDVGVVLHEHRGCDHRPRCSFTEDLIETMAVILAAFSERIRQPLMTDVCRLVGGKRSSAKNVIRVNVRQDHVADRQLRHRANRLAQPRAVLETPARIGDRDRLATDDEAYVGDRTGVRRRRLLVDAAANVNARRDFLRGERGVAWGSARCQARKATAVAARITATCKA